MLEAQSDDDLMFAVQKGETRAFQTLYRRHGRIVFGVCLRYLGGNQAAAEDVTQEVWSKVVTRAESYKPEGHFKAWLLQITRNVAIDEIRKTRRLTDLKDGEEAEIADTANIETELLQKYETEALQKTLDGLPENLRTVLMLWLSDDLSHEQIAETLGLTVAAARSLLFRAKRELKTRMERK